METKKEIKELKERLSRASYNPPKSILTGIKTKTGERISWKEAGKRFKEGIKNITPQQKLENEIRGTLITLCGFFVAFIAVLIKRTDIGLLAYGLLLIFLGSIITTGLKYIGMKQQLKFFKELESNCVTDLDFLKGGDNYDK